MNFYLLQMVGKWISLLILSVMSIFNFEIKETKYEIENDNINKNINVYTEIIPYETIKTYNNSIPNNIQKVVTTGQNGVVYTNENQEIITLEEKVNEQVVIGTGKSGKYNGIMTGYGPDCSTCSGVGNVACKTESRKIFNLINDGIYYSDDEYGEVRVLAAALSEFPCGTIIEVDSTNLGKFTGVVLDTGYDMRKNLEFGKYHIDVAFKTEKDEDVRKATNMSGNVIYNVQRWGW